MQSCIEAQWFVLAVKILSSLGGFCVLCALKQLVLVCLHSKVFYIAYNECPL